MILMTRHMREKRRKNTSDAVLQATAEGGKDGSYRPQLQAWGSGVTLFWGCAEHTVELVWERLLQVMHRYVSLQKLHYSVGSINPSR
jgi:hypothetical protein